MKKDHKNKACLALAICLVIILVSSLFASALQSNWWRVDVYDLRNKTNSGPWAQDASVTVNGKVVSGILFVPANASAENPQPAVVLTHGYLNNRELQLQNAIELARRGFVVLTVDREAHGNYENAGSTNSLFTRGLYDAAKYLYNLDYVDKTRIGVSGHSMGGCDTAGVLMEDASNATELANSLLGAFLSDTGKELTPANGYALQIVSAGLLQAWDNFAGADSDVSVGILKANDDEFFFSTSSWANPGNTLGDGSTALARDYLNSVYGANFVGINATGSIAIQNKGIYVDGQVVSVSAGQAAEPGFRVIYENNEIHPLNHFSVKCAADVSNFFYTAFGTPSGASYIAEGSEVWWVKELFSFIGLLAFFAMLLPLADLYLRVPLFQSLRGTPDGALVPALKGVRKNISYWATGIVCTLFSGFIILKFCTVWGKAWFPNTQMFPQDTTNWVAMWAIGTGLFALAVSLIVWGINTAIEKRKGNGDTVSLSPVEAGKISGGLGALVKTLLLAAALVASVYVVLYIIWGIFKVDFRIWSFDIKVFDIPTLLPTMLRYSVFFGIFYCINSVLNQSYRTSNLPEWATIAINAFFNVFGIFLVMMIQYVTFKSTGVLWQPTMNLGYIVLFPIIPVLIIATILSRKLYLKTGNAWLGGFVNALLFTIITCANTCSSFSYIMG